MHEGSGKCGSEAEPTPSSCSPELQRCPSGSCLSLEPTGTMAANPASLADFLPLKSPSTAWTCSLILHRLLTVLCSSGETGSGTGSFASTHLGETACREPTSRARRETGTMERTDVTQLPRAWLGSQCIPGTDTSHLGPNYLVGQNHLLLAAAAQHPAGFQAPAQCSAQFLPVQNASNILGERKHQSGLTALRS